jgi:hypothetical protein
MDIHKLQEKAIEIANFILGISEKEERALYKKDILQHLSDEEEYDVLVNAICSISTKRFVGIKDKRGGLKRKYKKNSQNSLTIPEVKGLRQNIENLIKKRTEPKNKKPEQIIESAFEAWLNTPENKEKMGFKIIGFYSSARKGKEGENVDGYAVGIQGYKYHLLFHPILTTFEVKPELPKVITGFNKAKGYLRFSHHVYLVFKFDGDEHEVKAALKKSGFEENIGVGVYYTRDGINFTCIYDSKLLKDHQPLSAVVEDHLDRLLDDNQKKELIKFKSDYLKSKITSVLGS